MILAVRGGGRAELHRAADLSGFIPSPAAGFSSAGVSVSSQTAGGIPAVTAAVRLAAQAVAGLVMGVWRGRDADRTRVLTTWQARFFGGAPNPVQTDFGFWETIQESLDYRGNAYAWRVFDAGRVVEMWALHPDQIGPYWDARGRLRYRVSMGGEFLDPVGQGPASYEATPADVLHIRGFGDGGRLTAPSPIARHRIALGASLAEIEHEASVYSRGASISLAVTYPETMTAEKAAAWRDLWKATYEGPQNAGKTAVLGGGATIQPIGLTQQDAQFIESRRFSVDEVARIFGVPASLLESAAGGKVAAPESEQTRWLANGLRPRLRRIESAIAADPAFFGPGARDYPQFDTGGFIRGDVRTESDVLVHEVQAGIRLADEARAIRGLPPLPDGAGQIPQIVPVGGGQNPITGQPPAPQQPTEE